MASDPSKPSIVDELRGQLAAIEGRQTELIAEREDEGLAYQAVVDRKPRAIKRLEEINAEIANLTTQAASLEPALREAVRRENVAGEEAAAEKRREGARQADVVLTEASAIAKKFDEAALTLREHSIAYERKMIELRRLTGISPNYETVRIHMFRTLKSAVHRSPIHAGPVAPDEVTEMSKIAESWSASVRNWIASVLDKTTAKRAA
jgi:hypothetical protein